MADNPYTVAVPNVMQALLAGEGAYDKAKAGANQDAIATALANNDIPGATQALFKSGKYAEGLGLLKMTQQQKAGDQFSNDLSNLFGGAPGGAGSPLSQVMTIGAPSQKPQGSANLPPPPSPINTTRVPVQSSPTVWGDKEAEDAGLYPPSGQSEPNSRPVGGQTQTGVPYTPQPSAPIAPRAPVAGETQQPVAAQGIRPTPTAPTAPTGQGAINGVPLAQALPTLIRAATNPNVPKEGQEMARALVLKALDDNKLPEEQKNYLRAQLDPNFRAYQLETRRASATAITNDMRGENAESAALGKAAGERAGVMMSAANKASTTLQNINRMSSLLNQVSQGKVQPTVMNVSAWAKSLGLDDTVAERLGLDPKAVGTSQAVTALTNEMAMGRIGSGGIPANNFSDADRNFLVQTVPGLAIDPRGNKIMLESARRMAQLDIQKAKEWQAFRRDPANKGKGFDDFDAAWADKTSRQDIFGDLRKQADALIGSTAPNQSIPGGAPSPQDIDAEIRRRNLR